MQHERYNKPITELAKWVDEHFNAEKVDINSCPRVGYLGYANGMSWPEWVVVDIAMTIIRRNGGNSKHFFQFDVDSSG